MHGFDIVARIAKVSDHIQVSKLKLDILASLNSHKGRDNLWDNKALTPVAAFMREKEPGAGMDAKF